jgi:cysteine desulfurase/selenocysteine lyase
MMDIGQVRRVRADIPALKRYVWFQNGGVSVTPAAIAEEHIRLMRELLTRGPMHIVYSDEEYPRREQSMARLSQFFAVAPAELALMRGVSEGYQTILRGLAWQSGDQIVTTVEEESSVFLPTLHVRDRLGVEVVKAPLVDDLEGQCAAIESCLTDRTRLIALSHVTTDLGFRLPVEQICQLARARGVLTFVDMAHSMGLYPIDLHAIGCDFAGILSYTWMYAPYAAGVLFVRQEQLNAVAVTYAGGRAEAWLDHETDTYALKETASRFEHGPWSWPLVHAWAFAADYLTDIGRDQIWARTVDLTARLKQGLAAIPGVTLYTPVSPYLSAALVSFGVAGWEGWALAQVLRERWNIIIKPLYISANGLRASVPFFLLEDEIDLLVEAVATLAPIRQARKGSP